MIKNIEVKKPTSLWHCDWFPFSLSKYIIFQFFLIHNFNMQIHITEILLLLLKDIEF